ncbi:MAG: hypothetical protein HS108_03280 [Planctomycetes bacterium]|nr:hypothetical protein [Planctomycetota bacterium]MCL4728924.1 hypothetical protein [Planctomycetota bacterium]
MKTVLTGLILLASAGLAAQPPVDDPPPREQPPKDAPLAPARAPGAAEVQAMIEEEVDVAVRRRMDDFAPLRSRRQLFLEFAGGVMTKYRQAQKSSSGDQPDGGRRAPNGIALGRAWISVFAAYSDIVESELEIRFNGDYTLLDEEIIEIPRAVIVYNRPLSQFLPGGAYRDSFLFGVDGHFWRQSRAGETMALGQRAFHQDEVAQIRYTARFLDSLYLIGALSDGNLLGFGQVDESNNYPILADDKTRYIRGLGDKREISRYLQLEFGGGFIWDFNANSFLRNNAHFTPEGWTRQNTNFLNVLAWGSVDRLSYNETALIEGLQRVPFKGGTQDDPSGRVLRAKWRMGANLDFALRVGGGDLVLQGHYVHAEDGRFVRNAWGVDVRYTFELPRIPYFLRITPMFRYSELVTNNDDNPLDATDPFGHPLRVSSGAVAGFSLADAAGFAANRREFMLGVNFTLARNVILGFEVVFNEEDFKQQRNVPNDVPNTFYLLRIGAEF